VDLGLERLQAPWPSWATRSGASPPVQVAGTNGKGSICTFLHAILLAAGIHAALYTSPHLVSWTERIRLDDPIAPELRRQLQTLQPLAREHHLTPFELVTAAAFGLRRGRRGAGGAGGGARGPA
jgi:dihydrofolate synthase / folylpolyglutamate synthase